MARVCQISGKRTRVGNTRSHAMNASKRTFKPNLHKKTVIDVKTGRRVKMLLATSALRTLSKKGLA